MNLDETIQDIEDSFGAGSILNLASRPLVKVDAISTGALTLDLALGIGGMPRGRIVELYGPESSGKTTVVQHVLANAQAQGLRCAFIDAEHAFDPKYAETIGIDIDTLLFSQPNSGEEALEIVSKLVESDEVGAIAIDSVAALTPRAELAGEMGQQRVGEQARMMGQAMRKLQGPASRSNTLLLFVNQIRERVGVMFGSPETQPGGRALKFSASQRIDIRRIETLKDGTEATANRVRAKIVKNKVAAPYRVGEFDIVYGQGINTAGCILDVALDLKLVKKAGGHFTFPDGTKAHGRANAIERIQGDSFLETEVRTVLGLPSDSP